MKRTHKGLALLLALLMVMAILPMAALAAPEQALVQFNKNPNGLTLQVRANWSTSGTDNVIAPLYEDESVAIYPLELGMYTYTADVPDEIGDYYSIYQYINVSTEDLTSVKVVNVDPGQRAGTEWEVTGNSRIYIPMEEAQEKHFQDPLPNQAINTPFFTIEGKAKHEFTTDEEMWNFLRALDEQDDLNGNHMKLLTIGQTNYYQSDVPMVVFTSESDCWKPEDVKALGKPIIFYQALIHGLEPQSGEAALHFIELLQGEYQYLLDKLSIIVVPRINGDGTRIYQRIPINDLKKDGNRDTLTYDLTEIRNTHGQIIQYDPHMYIDGHNFYATRSYTANGVHYSMPYDVMMSMGKNFNIPQEIRDFGNEVIVDPAIENMNNSGMRAIPYTDTSKWTGDPETSYWSELMPNSRHSYDGLALKPGVAVLLEGRGIGDGAANYLREVKTQAAAVCNLMQNAYDNAAELKSTVEGAWKKLETDGAIYGQGQDIVFEVAQNRTDYRIDFWLINHSTLEMEEHNIPFWTTTKGEATVTRTMPTAYILPKDGSVDIDDILDRFKFHDAEWYDLPAGTTVDVQKFIVETSEQANKATGNEGRPRHTVTVQTLEGSNELAAPTAVTFEQGAIIIPMDQKAACLLACSLEPDIDGGYVMFNLIGSDCGVGDTIPIYRYIYDNPRETFDLPPAGGGDVTGDGTTNVTATVEEIYSFNIPAKIDMEKLVINGVNTKNFSIDVSAALGAGQALQITIAPVNSNGFIMKTAGGAELPFTIKDANGNPVAPNGVFATVTGNATLNGTINVDPADIQYAGSYSATIQFLAEVVSVD